MARWGLESSRSSWRSPATIDGFDTAIRFSGSEFLVISRNLIHRNGIGVETFEAGPITIVNNLVLHNTRSGVRLTDSEDIVVAHNTIKGNGFGEALTAGGGTPPSSPSEAATRPTRAGPPRSSRPTRL